jgi:hypothetical protein
MTATVDILTGQKTVLDYLLKPVLRARERAPENARYRLNNVIHYESRQEISFDRIG